MESRVRNSFTLYVKRAVSESIVMNLTLARQPFVENAYTGFHENPTNALVVYTRSQADRRSLHAQGVRFLYFVKNA
jgi:hypothetical protein